MADLSLKLINRIFPQRHAVITVRTIVIGCDLRSPLINCHFGQSCDRAKSAANVSHLAILLNAEKYVRRREISPQVNLSVIHHQGLQ